MFRCEDDEADLMLMTAETMFIELRGGQSLTVELTYHDALLLREAAKYGNIVAVRGAAQDDEPWRVPYKGAE